MITVITVAFAKIDTNTIGTILKPNVQTPVKAIRVPTKNIPTVIAVFSILRQHTNAVVSMATIGNTLIALKIKIPAIIRKIHVQEWLIPQKDVFQR